MCEIFVVLDFNHEITIIIIICIYLSKMTEFIVELSLVGSLENVLKDLIDL